MWRERKRKREKDRAREGEKERVEESMLLNWMGWIPNGVTGVILGAN
jgi:hypothetical protein